MFENKEILIHEMEEDKANEDFLEGKLVMMNINEDPLLTGKVKHLIKDGNNQVGKTMGSSHPDISISGIGVVPNHAQIKYSESKKSLVLVPNKDAKKNKTHLEGNLVEKQVELRHGSKVLFGNNNLFIIVFPGEEVPSEWLDYEEAMNQVIKKQVDSFAGDKEMEEKLK